MDFWVFDVFQQVGDDFHDLTNASMRSAVPTPSLRLVPTEINKKLSGD